MQRYQGKIAVWFYMLIVLYHVIAVKCMFFITQWNIFYVMLMLLLFSVDIIFIPVIINNHVDLYENYFVFSYGFSKKRIAYKDIREMREGISCIASSANALHRIYIDTGNDELYIALKDNKGFIQEMEKRKNNVMNEV